MDTKIYYYLELTAINCIVRAKLNGVPAYNLNAKYETYFAKPINELLIGEKNSLDIELSPIIETKDINESIELPTYYAKGSIKLYREGEVSSPEEGEMVIRIEQVNKLISNFHFNNIKFDFQEIMLETKVVNSEEQVRNYAFELLNLLQNHDTAALYKAFEPKFKDHQIAYYKDEIKLGEDFEQYMSSNFYPNLSSILIPKEQLRLKPHCNKRIWEVQIAPDDPLFHTEENEEGDIFSIKIFIGLVNEQLKIVR